MEKTKFGVSVALLSMICYFTGYVNFTACIILMVAVWVWSDSYLAKINATQAVVLSVFFGLISTICNWISTTYIDFVNNVFGILATWWDLSGVQAWFLRVDFVGGIANFVKFIELVVMVVLVFMSLKNKEIKLPIIAKLVKKHFDEEETVETPVTEEAVVSPVVEETPVEEKPKKTTRRTKKTVQAETTEETKTE